MSEDDPPPVEYLHIPQLLGLYCKYTHLCSSLGIRIGKCVFVVFEYLLYNLLYLNNYLL